MNDRAKLYTSVEEIEAVVRHFESGTFAPGTFGHREHLTVVLWYLAKLDAAEATERMREGLYRFLDYYAHDRSKYHETITVFWIKRVSVLIQQASTPERSVADVANEVIAACADSRLISNYYSPELIASRLAREEWVEPDVQPLDF